MLGDSIKRLRVAKLLTRQELALLSGMTEKDIEEIEAGRRRIDEDAEKTILEAISQWNWEGL